MPTITVRNVPSEVRDTLAARAAQAGQSLQEYMRAHLIDVTAKPTIGDLMARVATRKTHTGTRLDRNDIITDRDADRR
ncbi:MAG: hypothetical protein M3349_07160 [Actinomycetota bacterium]|nr:hypothetical protein [Actinomycetota bacterium]